MGLTLVSRHDWGAAPAKRPSPALDPAAVTAAYLHYLGNAPSTPFSGAAMMRQIQRQHLNDTKNDYSDIAYSDGYDPTARVFYEGRGIGVRDGATRNQGGKSVSLLIMNGLSPQGNRPALTVANMGDINLWLARARGRYPNLSLVAGHREAPGNPTGCPGDDTVNLIHSGRIGLNVVTQPEDEVTPEQMQRLIEAIEDDKQTTIKHVEALRSELADLRKKADENANDIKRHIEGVCGS